MSTPARVGSTLSLFDLPFTFSQVELLDQGSFKQQAADWGYKLSDEDLEELDDLGLLVPFFVRRSEPRPVRLTAKEDDTREAREARDGRLDDPRAANYEKHADGERLYSQWQLLGLRAATTARANGKVVPDWLDGARVAAANERQSQVVLAALSGRFFPQIVGRWTAPIGSTFAALRRAARDLDARIRLEAVDAQPDRLRDEAEWLLLLARQYDPLGAWWRVVRYSNHHGWFKLKGASLQYIWYRIAAEVLLRAHEELADSGSLEPLPSVDGASFWSPLMDRIGASHDGLTLDQALTQMSVSPHPRVVLVVEGETEELHVNELLDVVGVGHEVRVVNQRTSGDNPHELARFLAPRIRDVTRDRQTLERNPTALYIAMDPEHGWSATELPQTVRKLRKHIRDEVRRQGGDVDDEELNELLNVRNWGRDSYELANFTDEELTDALLAIDPAPPNESARREIISEHVAYARQHHCDLKVVFQRLGWEEMKTTLAKQMAPVLVSKLDADDPPPVVSLVWDVFAAVGRFGVGTLYLKGGAV